MVPHRCLIIAVFNNNYNLDYKRNGQILKPLVHIRRCTKPFYLLLRNIQVKASTQEGTH